MEQYRCSIDRPTHKKKIKKKRNLAFFNAHPRASHLQVLLWLLTAESRRESALEIQPNFTEQIGNLDVPSCRLAGKCLQWLTVGGRRTLVSSGRTEHALQVNDLTIFSYRLWHTWQSFNRWRGRVGECVYVREGLEDEIISCFSACYWPSSTALPFNYFWNSPSLLLSYTAQTGLARHQPRLAWPQPCLTRSQACLPRHHQNLAWPHQTKSLTPSQHSLVSLKKSFDSSQPILISSDPSFLPDFILLIKPHPCVTRSQPLFPSVHPSYQTNPFSPDLRCVLPKPVSRNTSHMFGNVFLIYGREGGRGREMITTMMLMLMMTTTS